MDTLNLISQLERNLKAHIRLLPDEQQARDWKMEIQLFYQGHPAGSTSFNLHGYDQQEAEQIARNVKDNPFVMREIDEYLWGESD
ncbi:MAG: hypothetical protein SV765_13365 [Pseudomonadota bacterium]|nr:hypothetical protein [Pseudomonadales bacterium]MDY6921189.1 hypothetical protein [Pseudomonadota bacterium]